MKYIRKFNEGLPLEYPSYIQISITPNDKSIERTNLDS